MGHTKAESSQEARGRRRDHPNQLVLRCWGEHLYGLIPRQYSWSTTGIHYPTAFHTGSSLTDVVAHNGILAEQSHRDRSCTTLFHTGSWSHISASGTEDWNFGHEHADVTNKQRKHSNARNPGISIDKTIFPNPSRSRLAEYSAHTKLSESISALR